MDSHTIAANADNFAVRFAQLVSYTALSVYAGAYAGNRLPLSASAAAIGFFLTFAATFFLGKLLGQSIAKFAAKHQK